MDEKKLLEQGLTQEEVEERKRQGLYNGAYQVKTKTIGQILVSNIFTLFNFVNLFLAICVFLVGSYKNMMFLGVVFWNIGIGIFQQIRSKKVIDRLSLISNPKTDVLRDGKRITIQHTEICQDDILLLEAGNQICADSVILVGTVMVNESMLTGESNPIQKTVGDSILSGSYIISGSVEARVIHVGKENYINTIIGNAKYMKKPNSEIMDSTKFIIKVISICMFPIAFILFAKYNWSMHLSIKNTVVNTVSALVGMIPNGLMLLTTCVLAVGVIRLAKKDTLVQELYCIETLARVDVLCLDKTGTITEGTMELEDYHPVEEYTREELRDAISSFASAIADKNPTIMAIKEKFVQKSDLQVEGTIPFNSIQKWSLVKFKNGPAYVLGAPENVLKNRISEYQDCVQPLLKAGNRVLVFAKSDVKKIIDDQLPEDIQPMGFIVINEKIRTSAKDTLEYFKKQDVNVKIISGDNPQTVSAIAKRAGVEQAENYIDARTIKETDDLNEIVEKYTVFGRVTPTQKLSFVKALKENGHTVAMTGDGVNDVLALKEADCSIAMQSGSDAARNVSQLVLLKSDFSAMPAIVEEGRRSINNLERSATLYLEKTIYATLLALIFIFLPFEYPFEAVHLTLIGSLSIGIPSFILALEPNKERVTGHFLTKVFQIAIPSGLLVVGNVLLTMGFNYFFHIGSQYNETMATYSTFITAMIVLYHICKPFNLLKKMMLVILIGAFLLASQLMRPLFQLAYLPVRLKLELIVLGIITFFVYKFLRYLTKKVFHKFTKQKESCIIKK